VSPTAKNIDGYLAGRPKDQRSEHEKLRRTIKTTVPEAVESMSYADSRAQVQGKPLSYFGAAKNRRAIYGGINIGRPQGRTRRIRPVEGADPLLPDKPVPAALAKKLVKGRRSEIEAGAAAMATDERITGIRVVVSELGGLTHGDGRPGSQRLARRVYRNAG
jgi:uncharacterized protein YdhG (YjbR/CyaY superfamily)